MSTKVKSKRKKHPGTQDWYWHIHHRVLAEKMVDGRTGAANRRKFIKDSKLPEERPTRLKLLKPIKNTKLFRELFPRGLDALDANNQAKRSTNLSPAAQRKLEKLHKSQCKRCPWDGHTIFP